MKILGSVLQAQTFDFNCSNQELNYEINLYIDQFFEDIDREEISYTKGPMNWYWNYNNPAYTATSKSSCSVGYNIHFNHTQWVELDTPTRRNVVYHELGHAILHLDHDWNLWENSGFICEGDNPGASNMFYSDIMLTGAYPSEYDNDNNCTLPYGHESQPFTWNEYIGRMFDNLDNLLTYSNNCGSLKGPLVYECHF